MRNSRRMEFYSHKKENGEQSLLLHNIAMEVLTIYNNETEALPELYLKAESRLFSFKFRS